MTDNLPDFDQTLDKQRPPLTDIQRARMMCILLRFEGAFRRASELLEPKHFKGPDRMYSVLWDVALTHWADHQSLPTKDDLWTECKTRVQHDPNYLTATEVKSLMGFIKGAYRVSDASLQPSVGLNFLKQYLEEQLLMDVRQNVSREYALPDEVFGFMSKFTEKAAALSVLTDPGIAAPFPKDWDTKGRDFTPLGIEPVDSFLGGGVAPGEAYVFLGPVGSCKTLLSVQISTNMADYSRLDFKDKKTTSLGLSYYFYYEGTEDEIRQRAIVYKARIHKDRVTAKGSLFSRLARAKDPAPEYEYELFKEQIAHGQRLPCEFDRFVNAMDDLNYNWRPICMMPTKANPGRGSGHLEEIIQLIEDDISRHQEAGKEVHVCNIVVDYMGAMTEQWIGAKQLDRDKHYRPKLLRTPLFGKQMGVRYNCPVFLMHQLNAGGNKLVPTKLPSLFDSEGSNMIAENADFGITIGKPTLKYECLMGCEKARHASRRENCVFQIHGAYGFILPRADRVADPNSRNDFTDVQVQHGVVSSKGGTIPGKVKNKMPVNRVAFGNQAVHGV